jgi:SagB-type dehydrogenase family enzyme
MIDVATARGERVDLPPPRARGGVSLEEAVARRRSVRDFAPASLDSHQLSQLLWAAQGITRGWGARAAPSAGALYPLEVYVALPAGLCRYLPDGHHLLVVDERDLRPALSRAAGGQRAVREAAAVLILTAVYERAAARYGARARRYATLEAGHAAQNVLLQATALGLASVPVGAFDDEAVQACLGVVPRHRPLYLVPVGRPLRREEDMTEAVRPPDPPAS